MKIGLIGTGSVAQALAKGLVSGEHEIRFGSRNPSKAKVPPGTRAGTQRETTEWAEVVVMAIPGRAVKETVEAVGPGAFRGKIVVDPSNVIGPSGDLALGFSTSGAEELAKLVPGARVVKAFNNVFAPNMTTGKVGNDALTLFVAGDDHGAKEVAMRLGRELGFEPVDAGPLRSARYLEPMAMQLMVLGYGLKMGSKIGFGLVGRTP